MTTDERTSIKERIFTETTRLFGEHGFEGTPIQAIADAVGIRKPSLLYHFASKDELGDAVLKELIVAWEKKLPELSPKELSAQAVFNVVMEALVEFFREDPNRARLVLRESLDRPAKVQALVRDHLTPWMDRLAAYINLGKRTGVIRPEVEPLSYITTVLITAMGLFSIGDVATVFFGPGSNSTLSTTGEFVRIAQASLFIEN